MMISSFITRHVNRPATVMSLHISRPAITSQSYFNQQLRSPRFVRFNSDAVPTGMDAIKNGKDFSHTTKESLAIMLRDDFNLSPSDSKRAIDAVFNKIVESLAKNETVSIYGFGKFSSMDVPARLYVNPSNLDGPKVMKEATKRVKFTAFKHLKECVVAGKVIVPTLNGKSDKVV